jgi:hypothetical protein
MTKGEPMTPRCIDGVSPGAWVCRSGLVLLLLVFLSVPGSRVVAQVEVQMPHDTVTAGKISFTGYPYIFYSPETDFAIGGALIFTRRFSDNPEVKPSSAMISGYYSAKHSYDLFVNPEFFLDEDRYYLGISIDYWRYVDKFWGIGNNTPDADDLGYIRKIFWVNVEFDVSVAGPLKIGLNYDLNYTTIEDKQMNPYLLAGSVTGSDGGFSSGAGLVLYADTRNGAFYPTKGGSYKIAFLTAGRLLGSTFNCMQAAFREILHSISTPRSAGTTPCGATTRDGTGTSSMPRCKGNSGYGFPAAGGLSAGWAWGMSRGVSRASN